MDDWVISVHRSHAEFSSICHFNKRRLVGNLSCKPNHRVYDALKGPKNIQAALQHLLGSLTSEKSSFLADLTEKSPELLDSLIGISCWSVLVARATCDRDWSTVGGGRFHTLSSRHPVSWFQNSATLAWFSSSVIGVIDRFTNDSNPNHLSYQKLSCRPPLSRHRNPILSSGSVACTPLHVEEDNFRRGPRSTFPRGHTSPIIFKRQLSSVELTSPKLFLPAMHDSEAAC